MRFFLNSIVFFSILFLVPYLVAGQDCRTLEEWNRREGDPCPCFVFSRYTGDNPCYSCSTRSNQSDDIEQRWGNVTVINVARQEINVFCKEGSQSVIVGYETRTDENGQIIKDSRGRERSFAVRERVNLDCSSALALVPEMLERLFEQLPELHVDHFPENLRIGFPGGRDKISGGSWMCTDNLPEYEFMILHPGVFTRVGGRLDDGVTTPYEMTILHELGHFIEKKWNTDGPDLGTYFSGEYSEVRQAYLNSYSGHTKSSAEVFAQGYMYYMSQLIEHPDQIVRSRNRFPKWLRNVIHAWYYGEPIPERPVNDRLIEF